MRHCQVLDENMTLMNHNMTLMNHKSYSSKISDGHDHVFLRCKDIDTRKGSIWEVMFQKL